MLVEQIRLLENLLDDKERRVFCRPKGSINSNNEKCLLDNNDAHTGIFCKYCSDHFNFDGVLDIILRTGLHNKLTGDSSICLFTDPKTIAGETNSRHYRLMRALLLSLRVNHN